MRFLAAMLLSAAGWAATSEITAIETSKPMLDVTLVTNDGAKANEFYGEILGLHPLGSNTNAEGYRLTRYQAGAGAIEIVVPPKPAPVYKEEMHEAIGIRGLALYLNDADRVVKQLASHNQPALNFVATKGNIKVGRTKDPDGNWIELIFNPDVPPEKLNQMAIILMVADEAKSRAFYGKTLGLPDAPPHGKPETGLLYAYTSGGSTILVRGVSKDLPNHAGPPPAAVGFRAITFTVKDPAAVASFLKSRDIKTVGKGHNVTAVDPDGNYLRFVADASK